MHNKNRTTNPQHNNRRGKVINFYTGKEEKQPQQKIPAINIFALAAWRFAQTILWKDKPIDLEEQIICMDSIKIFFIANNHRKEDAFIEFCERVMLANWYVNAYPNRYVPTPAIWLNNNYQKGFTGTQHWHDVLELKRKQNPTHHLALKIFAIGYVEYSLFPGSETYNEAREILTELKEYGLLQHFNNCVLNFHYAA